MSHKKTKCCKGIKVEIEGGAQQGEGVGRKITIEVSTKCKPCKIQIKNDEVEVEMMKGS